MLAEGERMPISGVSCDEAITLMLTPAMFDKDNVVQGWLRICHKKRRHVWNKYMLLNCVVGFAPECLMMCRFLGAIVS